jgi:hypothetical protein
LPAAGNDGERCSGQTLAAMAIWEREVGGTRGKGRGSTV